MRFFTAVLLLPEASKTHGGSKLPGFAILTPGSFKSLLETALGGGLVGEFGQQQLTLYAVQLGLLTTLFVLLDKRQTTVESLVGVLEASGRCIGLAESAELIRQRQFRTGRLPRLLAFFHER